MEIYVRDDGVKVLNMYSLMLIDYDLPSDRHLAKNAVVGHSLEHLRETLDKADSLWVQYGFEPGPATWRIHRTAGGLHAFRMDAAITPGKRIAALMEQLACDPGYISLVRNTKLWPIRVSPKRANEGPMFTLVDTGDEKRYAKECLLQLKVFEALCQRYANR